MGSFDRTMSLWVPSHVQFTVLRAKNLISKGKGGNNDVFVTIQLGKEKYQTSTIRNARNPEWFEECDLPIPHLHSEIEVSVYHRGVLSDDFLGYATLPLWQQKISDQPQTQWVTLTHKPSKEPDNKYRGEVEVKVTFHSHSRHDNVSAGLKKRSASLRNLASAVGPSNQHSAIVLSNSDSGDKLKFARSKSFRENRKDPEGSKTGSEKNSQVTSALQNHSEPKAPSVKTRGKHSGRRGPPTPLTTVSFPALDLHPSWSRDATEEGMTRSYSMSAAYSGTMSLDRGHIITYTGGVASETGDMRSQSMLDIAGNRRTLTDIPTSQPPPPYQLRPSSHNDLTLLTSSSHHPHHPHHHPHHYPYPRRPVSFTAYSLDPVLRRERALYESIRERTEPETSTTSSEEEEEEREGEKSLRRRPRLPPRLRPRPRPRSEEVRTLDSNHLEEAFQSARSREEEAEAAATASTTMISPVSLEGVADGEETLLLLGEERPRPEMMTNGSLMRGEGRSSNKGSHGGGRGGGGGSGGPPPPPPTTTTTRHKSASSGDLNLNSSGDVRFVRKRTKRERLRKYRQGGSRRFTLQGMEVCGRGGLYDDSVSEACSDSSKADKRPEDLYTTYSNLSKEELLRLVIQNKAQLIRKDQYIRDLESYIDNLLVRVMETQPRILHRPPLHPR